MKTERKDRESLCKKAEEVIRNEARYREEDDELRVGVETEYFIIDSRTRPLDRGRRNSIAEKFNFARKELGEFTIELLTERSYLDGLRELSESIKSREQTVRKEISEDLQLIRNGVQPFTDPENVDITLDKGFESCMMHYSLEEERYVGKNTEVSLASPKATGLICAIHTNLEAKGFEDAVRKANYTYMISPYISAISGNARFLGGKDTGLSDLRMILWNQSHNSEGKIGVLDSYYDSMEDYLSRVVSQEFIPGEKKGDLERAVSNFWKDSRIKVVGEDLVVESRISSVQPTPEEDVAVHGFYIGRLHYALQNNEELMEIWKVNENRKNALRDGLDADLHAPEGGKKKASKLLLEEIDKARNGLEALGVDPEGFLRILENRARKGLTPSDRKADKVEKEGSGKKVIYEAIKNLSGVQQ